VIYALVSDDDPGHPMPFGIWDGVVPMPSRLSAVCRCPRSNAGPLTVEQRLLIDVRQSRGRTTRLDV
jgi:hypothetical protein